MKLRAAWLVWECCGLGGKRPLSRVAECSEGFYDHVQCLSRTQIIEGVLSASTLTAYSNSRKHRLLESSYLTYVTRAPLVPKCLSVGAGYHLRGQRVLCKRNGPAHTDRTADGGGKPAGNTLSNPLRDHRRRGERRLVRSRQMCGSQS